MCTLVCMCVRYIGVHVCVVQKWRAKEFAPFYFIWVFIVSH